MNIKGLKMCFAMFIMAMTVQAQLVCNQCLFTECGGPTTISSEVTNYDPTTGRFVLVTHISDGKVTAISPNRR